MEQIEGWKVGRIGECFKGWLVVWGLLDCMEREIFSDCGEEQPTKEKLERLWLRAKEIRELLEWCKEDCFLRLEDLDNGGGYAAIIRGLSNIAEQIENGGGKTVKEWREIEYQMIRVKIHAWAQKVRAFAGLREAMRAEVLQAAGSSSPPPWSRRAAGA